MKIPIVAFYRGLGVWKAITYPKTRYFLWQCLHKSIPIRDVLVARGIITPILWPLCNNASKSIIHMRRDYPQSRLFWDSLATPIQPDMFYGSNLEVWLWINCVSKQKSFSGLNWGYCLSVRSLEFMALA